MEETDATNDWLRQTDGSIDWLCQELGHWLAEAPRRPEVLTTLTFAMGGSQESPDEKALFKGFADALATLLKKGYRDDRFIFPVAQALQKRRLQSQKAGQWTTASRPIRYYETSRPTSPETDVSLHINSQKWQDPRDFAQHNEEELSRSPTPWSPPRTPDFVKKWREKQEQEEHKRKQKILREQERFRKRERCKELERLRQLAELQERLEELGRVQETPPSHSGELPLATQHDLDRHSPPRQSKRRPQSSHVNRSSGMNVLQPMSSSKVTKPNAPGQVKRARRQRIVEPVGRSTRQSTRVHLRRSSRVSA